MDDRVELMMALTNHNELSQQGKQFLRYFIEETFDYGFNCIEKNNLMWYHYLKENNVFTGTTFAFLRDGHDFNLSLIIISDGKNPLIDGNWDINTSIKAFKRIQHLPNDFTENIYNCVSKEHSPFPIYLYFDNTNNQGIMYYYTDADFIVMSENSSNLFHDLTALTNIEGVQDWIANDVTDLSNAFLNTAISSLKPLENWNTPNLIYLTNTFSGMTKLTSLKSLINWDTHLVTSMSNTFSDDRQLKTLQGLEDWNTNNVIDFASTFNNLTALENAEAINSWNNFGRDFYHNNLTIAYQSIFQNTNIRPTAWSGSWDESGTYTPSQNN